MTGQTNDAAERSASIKRGGPAQSGDGLHPVVEWRNADGQTIACARGVAELREENARLREAGQKLIAALDRDHARGETFTVAVSVAAASLRAALTPRAAGADAAPAGWNDGSNVR